MADKNKKSRPEQHQKRQPGRTKQMTPTPKDKAEAYRGAGKLAGKVALITGGDSGIGRSVAVAFAKEGADVSIAYLEESDDARETARLIEEAGRKCHLFAGDISDPETCRTLLDDTLEALGKIDVLINNAAEQHVQRDLTDIPPDQLKQTFETNIFSMFYLTQSALPHLGKGAAIVNTASITAFHGNPVLIDYSATKGAIVSFTRSLAKALVERGIRVNAVAPGPVWTPLIPASFDAEQVAEFGTSNPMGRAAEPDDISPCFVFLASADAGFMTGQILHPNGGEYFG